MPNTSATGGYLLPITGPIDANTLKRFLHNVIVGITGLTDALVRPAYQPNPPTIPDLTVDWCSFYISLKTTNSSLPWYKQDDLSGVMSRNENVDMLTSFYGPNCISYATILRDGFQICQNNDVMATVDMGFIGTSDMTYFPELINDKWYERADITINLNRKVSRTYEILKILSIEGTIQSDIHDGVEESFNA